MFDFLFGWRKASKCKKLITRVEKRIGPLMNKRSSIVRQLREDVAQLLRYGRHESAFYRAEQIIKDGGMVEVYEQLDLFCEFVKNQLPYIRRHKDCPNDIKEAVSSLIFASARCGDIPELRLIRKLFGERYGCNFTLVALELRPGNIVNKKIKESLTLTLVPDHAKYELMDTIARSSCITTETLEAFKKRNKNEESQLEASDVDLSSEGNKHQNHKDPKEGGIVEEYSSESSFDDFKGEEIIYVDDIEEYQYPLSNDGSSQDQRVFMFKSPIISAKQNLEGYDGEFEDEKAGSRRSISFYSLDNIINDVECTTYYGMSVNHNCKSYSRKSCSYYKDDSKSPPVQAKRRNSISGQTHNGILNCRRRGRIHQETKWVLVPQKFRAEIIVLDDLPDKLGSELEEEAYRVNLSRKRENQLHFSRAMTLPPLGRPKESQNDNVLRRNSFPIDNTSHSLSHVHPKLPDYDEIATKFRALKEAALKKKQGESMSNQSCQTSMIVAN